MLIDGLGDVNSLCCRSIEANYRAYVFSATIGAAIDIIFNVVHVFIITSLSWSHQKLAGVQPKTGYMNLKKRYRAAF